MNDSVLVRRTLAVTLFTQLLFGCSIRAAGRPTGLGVLIVSCEINIDAPGLKEMRPPLSFPARALGIVTAPFKYLGIFGWTDLAVDAEVSGRVYQDSAWSTDGFTTVDIEIESLQLLTAGTRCRYDRPVRGEFRYIRIEVKPWVASPGTAAVKKGSTIRASGRLKIDHDADFYEIHPTEWNP